MIIAHVGPSVDTAAKHVLGLPRHGAEPLTIARLVRHLTGNPQRVRRVYGRLRVVADVCPTAFAALQRPTLRSRQRAWCLVAGAQRRLAALLAPLPRLERLDLGCQSLGVCAASCPAIILRVAALELFEGSFDARVDRPDELGALVLGAVALFRSDCAERAASDRDQLRLEAVERLA
jgi:hypothetical protein